MPIQHLNRDVVNHSPTPSTPTTTTTTTTSGSEYKVLIAITVPTRHWKYVFKVRTDILIGELRKQSIETYNLRESDFINHGLYLPPEGGKKGKFLQDERTISDYPQLVATKLFDGNDGECIVHETETNQGENTNGSKSKDPVLLELLPKVRFVEEYRTEGSKPTKRIQSKHYQKRLLSAIKRNDIPRVTDLLNQGLDPNFQYPSNGVTPLGCAAELSDPREIILQLVNCGAHVDYRDSDTMTALHRAAICGNLKAIEVFLELGQNPNVRDNQGLTPLYYACSEDIHPDCIKRLLYDHAILGVTDDKGRQEIHQACLNGRSGTLEQLIIYGADLNAQVENHNTPIHLCVLADEPECLKLLLRCGASPTIVNSSGQTPYELAVLIERMHLALILQTFDEKQIEGVGKTPVYNKDRRPTIHGPRAVFEYLNFANNVNTNPATANTLNKLRKSISVDGKLPEVNYRRCLSFDPDCLSKQASPILNGKLTFTGKNNDIQSPGVKPLLPIKTSTINNNNNGNNNRSGQAVYSRSNSVGVPLNLRKINQLRQNFPNIRIRSVTLERGTSGYGFVMQGTDNFKERFNTSVVLPTQRIMSVQPDSKAEKAGLLPGDYFIEINGIDVYDSPHTQVVDLISSTRDMLTLKIVNFIDTNDVTSSNTNGSSHSNGDGNNIHNNSISSSNSSGTPPVMNSNSSSGSGSGSKHSRTSFIRADLRRRNTHRSLSFHTAAYSRRATISDCSNNGNSNSNEEPIINTNIVTNTTNNNTVISSISVIKSTNDDHRNEKLMATKSEKQLYRPYNHTTINNNNNNTSNAPHSRLIRAMNTGISNNNNNNNTSTKKFTSSLLIIKDEGEPIHQDGNKTTPDSPPASSSSPYRRRLISTSDITDNNTNNNINSNNGHDSRSGGNDKLQRALSETRSILVSRLYRQQEEANDRQAEKDNTVGEDKKSCQKPETQQSTTIILYSQSIKRDEEHEVSSSLSTSFTSSSVSSGSSIVSGLPPLYSSSIGGGRQQLESKTKHAENTHTTTSTTIYDFSNMAINNKNNKNDHQTNGNNGRADFHYEHRGEYHSQPTTEKCDSSWDSSESDDIGNISEITEISENSLKPNNKYTININNNNNNNNGHNVEENTQRCIDRQATVGQVDKARMPKPPLPPLSLTNNKLTGKEANGRDREVNGKTVSTTADDYVHHIIVKSNIKNDICNGNNDNESNSNNNNNNDNSQSNDSMSSEEQTIQIDQSKMNGHNNNNHNNNNDDDELGVCLI